MDQLDHTTLGLIIGAIGTHLNLLELHGGNRYNLNSILHLDEDIDEETEAYINFKVSEYYDVDTIKSYSIGNKNSINIMSINA